MAIPDIVREQVAAYDRAYEQGSMGTLIDEGYSHQTKDLMIRAALSALENVKQHDHELQPKENLTVCDFGAGTGLMGKELAQLPGAESLEVFPVEISSAACRAIVRSAKYGDFDNLRCYPPIRYHGTEIPFQNECFNIVLAADVMEHVHDLPHTLNEIWRIMDRSGVFVMNIPLPNFEVNYASNKVKTRDLRTLIEMMKLAAKRTIRMGRADFQANFGETRLSIEQWEQLLQEHHFAIVGSAFWPQEPGLSPLSGVIIARKGFHYSK